MIIVDFNQVIISNLMMQLGSHTNTKLDENMLRHMVLNSIRSYKQKFYDEYGEIVIAADHTNCWRKQKFPYYKANRKKNNDKSDLDWPTFYTSINKIRNELKEYFPYKVIHIETVEADDIIATLIMKVDSVDKFLILSGDKDFIQLHRYAVVKQYDPVRKKWITNEDPEKFLFEHILKGDSGDGIPNVLSDDNCFVIGERQKPLTQKRIDAIYKDLNKAMNDQRFERNYHRNKLLIDLSSIPLDIQNKVLYEFEEQPKKDRSKVLNYLIDNKLKLLTEHIMEF
jgi:hypothetical protein